MRGNSGGGSGWGQERCGQHEATFPVPSLTPCILVRAINTASLDSGLLWVWRPPLEEALPGFPGDSFFYPKQGPGHLLCPQEPWVQESDCGYCSPSVSLGDNRDHWLSWGYCPLPSALSSLLSAPAFAQESCLAGKLWQVGGKRKAARQKQLPVSGGKSGPQWVWAEGEVLALAAPLPTVCGC